MVYTAEFTLNGVRVWILSIALKHVARPRVSGTRWHKSVHLEVVFKVGEGGGGGLGAPKHHTNIEQ